MLEKLSTNKPRRKRIPDKERGLLQILKTASKHNTILYRISQELIDKTVESMIVSSLTLYETIVGPHRNLGVNKKTETFVANTCSKSCARRVHLCTGHARVFTHDLAKRITYVWNHVWTKLNVYI